MFNAVFNTVDDQALISRTFFHAVGRVKRMPVGIMCSFDYFVVQFQTFRVGLGGKIAFRNSKFISRSPIIVIYIILIISFNFIVSRNYLSVFTIAIPSSSSCSCETTEGASLIGSLAFCTFGNAVTSRRLSQPHISMESLSRPIPAPP